MCCSEVSTVSNLGQEARVDYEAVSATKANGPFSKGVCHWCAVKEPTISAEEGEKPSGGDSVQSTRDYSLSLVGFLHSQYSDAVSLHEA